MRTSMPHGMAGLNHMRPNMAAGMNANSNNVNINSPAHNVNNNNTNISGNTGLGWMNPPSTPTGGGGSNNNTNLNNAGGGSTPIHGGSATDTNSIIGGNHGNPLMWGEMADSLMERGRSKNWTYEETMELITTYTSEEWQNKFSSEKKNHRAIWAEMADVLKKREGVTGDEARQRLNNLKALYNRIRRQLIAGEIASPQWEYWESLHHFLSRPSQYPAFGFPRTSPPIRTGHTPPMHPNHQYPSMPHMQLPRPIHHARMQHMMSHPMNMQPRHHDMQSTMPHFPPFKVRLKSLACMNNFF